MQAFLQSRSRLKPPRWFLLGFVILTLLSMIRGVNLTVDANLTSPNGNSYPDLSSAITALLTGQNLTNSNNTIILLDSCVNKPQYFPNSTKIGPSVSAKGRGTLRISYINTPAQFATDTAVTNQSICSLIPTIVLGNGSSVDIEYLDSFSIQGVNIQYNGDTALNYIYSVGTINISHFCFNNSEPLSSLHPPLFLNSSFANNFTIDTVSTFVMTDGIYLYDTLKTLSISSTYQINIDSLVFVNLDLFRALNLGYPSSIITSIPSIPAVRISSDTGKSVSLTISNIQITCVNCGSESVDVTATGCWTTSQLISVNNVDAVSMSSIALSSCRLMSEYTPQRMFVVQEAKVLIIDSFMASNFYKRNLLVMAANYLVYVSAVKTVTISNVNFTNCWLDSDIFFYATDDIPQINSNYYPMSLNFTGWILNNVDLDSYTFINCSFTQFSNFGGGILQNFFVSDVSLISNSFLVSLNVQDVNVFTSGLISDNYSHPNTTRLTPQNFAIKNFTMMSSSICFTSAVGHFNIYNTAIIEDQEIVYVYITSLNSTGNSFNSAYFFQAAGMGTYITNSVIQADTYVSKGCFYSNTQTISTLVVSNITVNNLSLQDQSAFISANTLVSRSLQLIISFWCCNDKNGVSINYAETKPFIINNSTFSINAITGSSLLIVSTNPQVIINQNIVSVNDMNASGLMQIGNYKFFNTPFSTFYDPLGYAFYSSPYPSEYISCPQVEKTIFQNYQDLYQVFLNTRALLSLYDPVSPVFFISVQQNTFNIIQGQDNQHIIEITNFEFPRSAVAILNNSFINVSSTCSSNLISYDNINRGTFSFNSLSRSDLNGYFFLLQSDYFKSISFVGNTINNTQEAGLYSIQSPACDNITIRDGVAANILSNWTFVNINCNSLYTQILFTNSTFQNITRVTTPGLLAAIDFISILNNQLNGSSQSTIILFEDVFFGNILLNNSQFATQGMYESSLFFIISIQASFQFINTNFNSIIAKPDAGIMKLSVPAIKLTNSTFLNMSFGDANGAIDTITNLLIITGCIFERNIGFQIGSGGLFKLSNRDPSNPTFAVQISHCVFSENVAPSGSILYTTSAFVNLTIDNITMLNNQQTEQGRLIYFSGGSNCNVSITNTNIIQIAGYTNTYPSLQAISFDGTGENMSVNIENCTLAVSGSVNGAFLSTSTLSPINLILNNISYTSQNASSSPNNAGNSQPSFGLFQGDNFVAQVTGLQAIDVSLSQTSLFAIHCNTAGKASYNWSLIIDQSVFFNMNLREALIQIDSDGYTSGALNNLSLLVQNTQFSNISWLPLTATATSDTNSGAIGGIIESLTSQIGRDIVTPTPPSTTISTFAVSLQSCSFTNFTGAGALVFNAYESMYDAVLLVSASNFSNLSSSSSGSGGVFNPSTVLLASFSSSLPPLPSTSSSRNNGLMILQSSFRNISAQTGCIVYWQSAIRGFSVLMENSTLNNITCEQNGGVFYANYYGSDSLNTLINNSRTTLAHILNITTKNNTVFNVSVIGSGGFMFLSGESTLFQVDIENNEFNTMNTRQNGGVICTSNSSKVISESLSTTANTRLLLSQPQNGSISMIGNYLTNIIAINGGIIFDTTNNNTINFSIVSNSFIFITASRRGGVLYVTKPTLNITGNAFTNIAAGYAGDLVYSVYGDLNGSGLADSNIISDQSESLVALGPTNLMIEFISILDGSKLPLENGNLLPYNPTAPDLTSYSLTQYLINITLIYRGVLSTQVVFDESKQIHDQILITMYFSSLKDSNNPQKYVGSNCSDSTCTAFASDIVLKGLAGDIILVDVTYKSAHYTQLQQFYITLRGCIPGEINQTDSCTYCKSGTYSLTPTDSGCNNCPNTVAICNGGANISINPGFYRSNLSSTTLLVFACNDTNARRCLGGQNNTCIKSFTGPACLQCNGSAGYISSGKVAQCDQCYKKETLIIYAVFLLIATIGYQIIMVYVTYNDNKSIHEQAQQDDKEAKSKLKSGQLMVIFSTFSQIASTFANMDVGAASSVLSIVGIVGNSNTKVVFPLRCLYGLALVDDFSELRFQILLYVFSPVAKVLIVVIIEIPRNLIWRDKEGFKAGIGKSLVRIGAVAVVITLLEQPKIIEILCAYLTCNRLDPYIEDTYIQGYNTIQCSGRYYFFSHLVVIPALVFWAFIVPLIIFLGLYKNRKKLPTSLECRLVLGNFYSSYKEKSYYWALVIIFLKIIIFVLNAILGGSQVVKAVVFIIIIHLYFLLLRWRLPFLNHRLMIAEKLCCYAYMVMLTLVLFRISLNLDWLRKLCSILILVSIVIAGAYTLINLALLSLAKVRVILGKLRDTRRQKQKDQKMLAEILKVLEVYHMSSGNHHDKHGRRKAITISLPERLRKTEAVGQALNVQVKNSKPKPVRSKLHENIIRAFFGQNTIVDEKQTEENERIAPNEQTEENQRMALNEKEICIPSLTILQTASNEKKVIDLEFPVEKEDAQTAQKHCPNISNNSKIGSKLPLELEIRYENIPSTNSL